MTISGWIELERMVRSPMYNAGQPAYSGLYWVKEKTGEQECPDCLYKTSVDDMFGIHNCPQMRDGAGQELSIGDLVYAYAGARIRKARITKYKKQTDNIGIEEAGDPLAVTQEGKPNRYTVTHHNKILRADDQTGN